MEYCEQIPIFSAQSWDVQRRAGKLNPIADQKLFFIALALQFNFFLENVSTLFQTSRQNIPFFQTKRSKSLHKAKQTESAEKTHPSGSHIHFHAYKRYSFDVLTYTKI